MASLHYIQLYARHLSSQTYVRSGNNTVCNYDLSHPVVFTFNDFVISDTLKMMPGCYPSKLLLVLLLNDFDSLFCFQITVRCKKTLKSSNNSESLA